MADPTDEKKPAGKLAKGRRKPEDAAQGSGLGIGAMGDLSGLLADPTPASGDAPTGGKASEIAMELIEEDPNQPRTTFDPASLEEMAGTIALRGVKTPISVRPHPDQEGRFLINHGARRFRASGIAGKTTIPAFVDADYTEADQVIENLQRDALTAREIADFIGRELAKKVKKQDIAKAIGKSNAYVTQHAALLDLPDPIAEIFQSERCRDVTLINELVGLYKKHPEGVTDWLDDEEQEITRGSVRLLKEFLTSNSSQGEGEGEGDTPPAEPEPAKEKEDKEVDPDKLKKAIVTVEHYGRPGRLMLNRRPSREGVSWMKYDDDRSEFEAELGDVRLVSVIEG
ncbi:ParB/RepB/Spo0J family partition protein [Sphingomonas sp. PAMC 26605]|uniref:ParB/RepB/Spo0J family partition protein n=1 Tax=Sphingomonas sp. PAMC 26605 TaxID=1112214 RepID=UPI00026CB1B9|nr:ParB/RepB/Spo0J family partition protein [Sphingomonas sp. PAMC 26605]